MKLNTLYLKIGDLGLPVEFTYGFLKRSRFICNYLEREVLEKIKFNAEGFNRIVIALCSAPKDGVFVNSEKIACVDIPFERHDYESRSGVDLSFYYMEKLRVGLKKCERFCGIPKNEIFQGLEAFVSGGMINEWLHKKRRFNEFTLGASLRCCLTQDAFRLNLEVIHREEIVFNEVILQTDPDENAFKYRFNDIRIDGQMLVVTSRIREPLWKKPLKEMF